MILAKSVIKDKFWILEENAKRVGMMNFKDNKFSININRTDYEAKDNADLKKLGIEFVIRDFRHGGHLEVMGYPTDREEVYNVKEIEGYPTFTKKPESKSVHVSGWYGIKFKNGWVTTLCPRLSTVKNNVNVGPYKSKMDLKVVLGQQKDGLDINEDYDEIDED
jgi:hypothetical protein